MAQTQEELLVVLTEARAAYHSLVTGKMPRVIVDQNGERVEFTAANKTALYNYIKELESMVEPATGTPLGPARFVF